MNSHETKWKKEIKVSLRNESLGIDCRSTGQNFKTMTVQQLKKEINTVLIEKNY